MFSWDNLDELRQELASIEPLMRLINQTESPLPRLDQIARSLNPVEPSFGQWNTVLIVLNALRAERQENQRIGLISVRTKGFS